MKLNAEWLTLKLEVLLEDGGKAIPLQHRRLLDQLFVVVRQILQVEQQRDTVAVLRRRNQQIAVDLLEQIIGSMLLQLPVELE